MSLARGLASAFDGFSKGVRLAREEEESEQRKKMQDLQMEREKMQLDAARREEAYQADLRRLGEDVARERQGGIKGEVVDEFGVSLGTQTYYGGNKPEAMGLRFASEPQQVAPKDPFKDMTYGEELIRRRQEIEARHAKLDPEKAIQLARNFEKAQMEGVLDAGRYFLATKDAAGALEKFNRTGKMKLPDGVQFVSTTEDILPGVDNSPKMPSFKVLDKDGKEITDWGTILNNTLPIDQLLSRKTEVGKAVAQFALEKKKGENQETQNLAILENARRQTELQAGRLALERDRANREANAAELNRTIQTGTRSIHSALGYNPNPKNLMTEAEKKQYAALQNSAQLATYVFELNIDGKTGKPKVSPSQAVQVERLLRRAASDPRVDSSLDLSQKDDGWYLNFNGKQVLIPNPQSAANAPEPAPDKEDKKKGGKRKEERDSEPAFGGGRFGIPTGGINLPPTYSPYDEASDPYAETSRGVTNPFR